MRILFLTKLLLLVLLFGSGANAQLSLYSFSTVSGTFTPLTGATTFSSSSGADSYASPVTGIGFTFNFDGVNYTQFSATSNGWIRLGSTAASAFTTTPISTAASGPAISFFSRDGRSGASGISYLTSGSVGSRVLTIEYLAYQPQYNSATNTLNVQVKLYEGTNVIEIVYGTSARANAYTGQVGIVSTATTNFSNRTSTTDWSASTAGGSNTATMSWSSTVGPASGLTYRWNPPSCYVPTSLVNSPTSSTTANHSWTAPSVVPSSGYEWAVTTSATPPASGTASSGVSVSSTGLTPNTVYYLHVRSNCGGSDFSAWATSTFTTPCDPFSLPYFNGFETGYTHNTTVGSCLTQATVAGAETWMANNTLTDYNRTPRTGSWNAFLRWSNTDWLFIPVTVTSTASHTVSLYARQDGATGTNANIQVSYGTANNAGAMTNTIVAATNIVNGNYQLITGTFTPASTGVYYVGIRGLINSNPFYISIDDITIELTPSCIAPVTLNNTVTSLTTTNHSWTAPSPAPSSGYEWAVTTSATPPASGTSTTGLTASSTGLTANTTYYLHVRSNCGGSGFSSWTTSSFFTGYCVPSGSTTYYLTNVVTSGGVTNFSNPTTTGGYNNYSSSISCSNYIGSPTTITLSTNTGTHYFFCWIDWNNDLDFADANESIFATSSFTAGHTGTINIPAGTPNGSYRLRVANTWSVATLSPCGPAANGEYEDYTFTVVSPPTCFIPTGLTANVVSLSAANISWSAPTSGTAPSGYEYIVQLAATAAPSNSAPAGTGTANATTSVSGVSLPTNSNWSLYVRSDCGSGSFSNWAGPFNFSNIPGNTCALPIIVNSYPYTDNNTTCGKVNDYGTQCSGSYGGGEDAVYEIQIATPGLYQIAITGTTTYIGWFLKNGTSCATGSSCLANAVSGSSTTATGTYNFTAAGTYYLIIDHWPAPNCGTYNLQITQLVPPTCVASQTATPDPACANYDVVLAWPAVAGATGYRITMGTTSGGTQVANNQNIGNVTTINLTNPQLNTTYYWTVIPYNAAGNASSCMEYSFTTGATACLCIPTYTDGKTDGDLISNVSILGTTLSNNTGTAEVNPAYTYFTGQPNYTADLQAGTSYQVQVSVGSYGSQNMAAWIDFNNDNIFQTTERIGFTSSAIAANGTATFTISLPCNPVPGIKRMRIRDVFSVAGNAIDPCANYGYGETEDYDVNVLPPPPCPSITGLVASAITFNSATVNWNIGCAETQWNLHVSTSATPPTGTPSNPGLTTNSQNLTGLLQNTLYYVHVRPVCGPGNLGAWTTISFTTAYAPPVNDMICGAKEIKPNAGATTSLNTYGFFSGMSCFNQTDINNAASATGVNEASCGGANGKSVWYKFTTPACAISGTVPFQIEFTTDNGGTTVDTKMALFSSSDGSCTGTMTQLACNDDATSAITTCGGTATNRSVILTTTLAPNTTYYLVVDEYGGNDNGTYEVSGRALIPAHTATVTGGNSINISTADRGAALNTYYVRLQGTTGHTITNTTALNVTAQAVNGNTYLSQVLYRCVNTASQYYLSPVVTTVVPANAACSPVTTLSCSNSGSTYTLTWPSISGLYTGTSGQLTGYTVGYRVIGSTGYSYNSNVAVNCSGGICTIEIPNLTNPLGYEFWIGTRCSATSVLQSNITTCDGGRPMNGDQTGDTFTFTNTSSETQYVDVKLSDNWNNFGLELNELENYYIYINENQEIVAQKVGKESSVEEMFDFELVPNPTTSVTTLVVKGNPSAASYSIYDTQGRMMSNGHLNGVSTTIDGQTWSSGVYLVTVKSGNKQYTKRLTIAK